MAREAGAELVLVHAWYVPPATFGGDYPMPTDLVQEIVDGAQRGLAAATDDAIRLGAPRVTSRVLHGVPWDQIVEIAREDPAVDLIVMGTHGRGFLAHALIGSVAERVVRRAPCPVLTVRQSQHSFLDASTRPAGATVQA